MHNGVSRLQTDGSSFGEGVLSIADRGLFPAGRLSEFIDVAKATSDRVLSGTPLDWISRDIEPTDIQNARIMAIAGMGARWR